MRYVRAIGRTICLGGRLQPKAEAPRLHLKDVINLSSLPTVPRSHSWGRGPALNQAGLENVLANDRFGCCTISAAGHIKDYTEADSGNPYTPVTADQVISDYATLCPGFNPATDANDNGCDELTVLDYWRDNGLFGGHKILAHATVDPTNEALVAAGAYLFAPYLGMGLPDAWVSPMPSASQFVWNLAGSANPNNGHAVPSYGYNRVGLFIDTWGLFGTITWPAVAIYCSGIGELHVVITQDAFNRATQLAPTGFDAEKLLSLMAQIGQVAA